MPDKPDKVISDADKWKALPLNDKVEILKQQLDELKARVDQLTR